MPKLSIIIPVFNEERTIKEILSHVKSAPLPSSLKREIIVIDDASRDNSLKILQSIKGIKLLHHKKNQGKGAAIRTGLAASSGDLIIIQDADLEYDPKDYHKLTLPVLTHKAKVVYGTRLKNYPVTFFGKKRTPFLSHYLGNKFLSLITTILYGTRVSDMETCYKVFAREVVDGITIESDRFEFEPEITAKILKQGYTIHEVPIKVKPRGYDEGKKITWKDGFSAVKTLLKYKFTD